MVCACCVTGAAFLILWAFEVLRLVVGFKVPPRGPGVWRPLALALVGFGPRGTRFLVSRETESQYWSIHRVSFTRGFSRTQRRHKRILSRFALIETNSIALRCLFSKRSRIVFVVAGGPERCLSRSLGRKLSGSLVQGFGSCGSLVGVDQIFLVAKSQHGGELRWSWSMQSLQAVQSVKR